MSVSAISIEHLTKRYRTGTLAVDNLSLEVAEGEFFGLLGPNGAGKSTTIHCTTGIATITSGSIKLFGRDVEKDYKEARKLVGLAPQEFNVDFFGRPRDILMWMGGYFGMESSVLKPRVEEMLARFDLLPHANKEFRALSGGLKRRLMLARALIHDPRIIILDEPTAGVDVELRRDIWKHLTELNKEGKTIILTSHYLEEVELLCERIAIVNNGKVAAVGSKKEFTNGGRKLEEYYLSITEKEKKHAE